MIFFLFRIFLFRIIKGCRISFFLKMSSFHDKDLLKLAENLPIQQLLYFRIIKDIGNYKHVGPEQEECLAACEDQV